MPENKECKEVISEKNFTISGNTIKSIDKNKHEDEEKYTIKGDTLCLEKVFISQGKNVTVTTKLLKQQNKKKRFKNLFFNMHNHKNNLSKTPQLL